MCIYNYIYIYIYVCIYNYIYKSDLYIRFDLYIYISILRFAPQNSFYEYNILYLWVDVPYFECWPIDFLWEHERGDLGVKKEWRVLHVGLGEQKTGSSCYLTLWPHIASWIVGYMKHISLLACRLCTGSLGSSDLGTRHQWTLLAWDLEEPTNNNDDDDHGIITAKTGYLE